MYIEVTAFVEEYGPDYQMCRFSDSVANSGLANIGTVTWRNALQHAEREPLTSSGETLEALRDHFAEYGAWDRDVAGKYVCRAPHPVDLNAMAIQEIAASYQEIENAEHADELSGRLYRADDGRWYYYIGL